jgi:hypothetical protein
MTTQRARSPRDGSKIDLQSLHARYNQVTQIAQCLRISIESDAGYIEPAAVCRAIVDMLDDINSDLWTFLEPALLRRRTPVNFDASSDTNGLHYDSRALNGNGTDRAMTDMCRRVYRSCHKPPLFKSRTNRRSKPMTKPPPSLATPANSSF